MIYMKKHEKLENFIKILKIFQLSFTFFEDNSKKNIIDLLIDQEKPISLKILTDYLIEFPPPNQIAPSILTHLY